jgi:hypothetical protein
VVTISAVVPRPEGGATFGVGKEFSVTPTRSRRLWEHQPCRPTREPIASAVTITREAGVRTHTQKCL